MKNAGVFFDFGFRPDFKPQAVLQIRKSTPKAPRGAIVNPSRYHPTMISSTPHTPLPYRIAVLCYLFDEDG
ncbi:MAG: hypothetical protein ACF8OB_03320, partial [Phycisphaeraceae bacterium JB051]